MRLAIFVAGCVACGGGSMLEPVNVVAPIPEGVVEIGDVFVCPDTVLNDQLTTGGRRVTTWQPCYDLGEPPARIRRDRVIATYEEQRQGREYDFARTLPLDEQAACAGVPLRERDRSPFWNRQAIDKVEPVSEDGELVGVRVVFERRPGLTAESMRRHIECQRARWQSLGEASTWHPDDPTLVEDAHASVLERDGHVEVIVTTPSPEHAELALARARDQRPERAASR